MPTPAANPPFHPWPSRTGEPRGQGGHDVRTPLNVALGLASVLRPKLADLPTANSSARSRVGGSSGLGFTGCGHAAAAGPQTWALLLRWVLTVTHGWWSPCSGRERRGSRIEDDAHGRPLAGTLLEKASTHLVCQSADQLPSRPLRGVLRNTLAIVGDR